MKSYKYIIFSLLGVLLFSACSDDIKYEDSREPASIFIKGIKDNTLEIYTDKTLQIEVGILPDNAEMKEPAAFIYKSSNKDIFEVSSTGLISAKAVGQGILTIESSNYSNLKTKAVVKITDEQFAVEEIKVDEAAQDVSLVLASETIVGQTISLSKAITVLPDNASNKVVEFFSSDDKIAQVSEDGVVLGIALGEVTITIKATDGSGVLSEVKVSVKELADCVPLDRAKWTVETSHKLPKDDAISNAPESLIDGDIATCLSMVKPGKTYAGVKVDAGEEVFFVLDRQNNEEFDYVSIQHRKNPYLYLRPYTYTIYGKNEVSEDFTPVTETITAIFAADSFIIPISKTKYRFVKIKITPDLETSSGSSMQIAELELGKIVF